MKHSKTTLKHKSRIEQEKPHIFNNEHGRKFLYSAVPSLKKQFSIFGKRSMNHISMNASAIRFCRKHNDGE